MFSYIVLIAYISIPAALLVALPLESANNKYECNEQNDVSKTNNDSLTPKHKLLALKVLQNPIDKK